MVRNAALFCILLDICCCLIEDRINDWNSSEERSVFLKNDIDYRHDIST